MSLKIEAYSAAIIDPAAVKVHHFYNLNHTHNTEWDQNSIIILFIISAILPALIYIFQCKTIHIK